MSDLSAERLAELRERYARSGPVDAYYQPPGDTMFADVLELLAEVKRQSDRADLLHDALADATRNIPGVTDAANRANAVLRADTGGRLSPRHTDSMGRPVFCDDAEDAVRALEIDLAETAAERDALRENNGVQPDTDREVTG